MDALDAVDDLRDPEVDSEAAQHVSLLAHTRSFDNFNTRAELDERLLPIGARLLSLKLEGAAV